jgi:hypothetical protein
MKMPRTGDGIVGGNQYKEHHVKKRFSLAFVQMLTHDKIRWIGSHCIG